MLRLLLVTLALSSSAVHSTSGSNNNGSPRSGMLDPPVFRRPGPAFTSFGSLARGGSRTTATTPLSDAGSVKTATATATTNDTDFSNAPMSQVGQVSVREAPLIHDIELLGNILSEIVQSENPRVHDLFEEFRQYGLERAAESSNATATAGAATTTTALGKMVARAASLTSKEALGLMRSFSIMLNLVNSAEVQHRQRSIRLKEASSSPEVQGGPLPLVEDSVGGTVEALLQSGLATKDQIYEQLIQQKAEIVLTAHPTEVQRKSLLRKYSQVSELLAHLDRPDLSAFERSTAHSDLKRIMYVLTQYHVLLGFIAPINIL